MYGYRRFFKSSSDNLLKRLGKNYSCHLNQEFNVNVLDLLKKKGFVPYDYWDSFEKFKGDLHSKENFFNTLPSCDISDKNFKHVVNVWKAFKTNAMKEYHDLDLKFNVLLLLCVFGTFKKESINSFELDPVHYFSTRG